MLMTSKKSIAGFDVDAREVLQVGRCTEKMMKPKVKLVDMLVMWKKLV